MSKQDAASQHNRLSLSTGHLNFVSARHKKDEAVNCEGFLVSSRAASSVDSITDLMGSRRAARVSYCAFTPPPARASKFALATLPATL